MNIAQRLELWGDQHHPKWLDIVRIFFGLFLCYTGFRFLSDINVLLDTVNNRLSFGGFGLVLLSHYVVFAHIMGGFLLALGLLTRFACLIQIPVLIGALFFANSNSGLWAPFDQWWMSALTLILLFVFLVVGNGAWSFDWFVKRDKAS